MPVVSPTSAFTAALRYGAMLVQARFTVYTNGSPNGPVYYGATSTGSFTVDRNSARRRSGQITIEVAPAAPPAPIPALLPTNPQSLLTPFGNEVFIECGIASSMSQTGETSVTQWVPLGLYTIATSDVDDTTVNLVVTLDLSDRSLTISQRAFQQPYNFPAASGNFVDEVMTLLNSVWNQQVGVAPLQYNIVPTSATVPVASYNQGADPWQAAIDIATVAGYELYFDAYGVVTGKPIPDPTTQPITWNFTDDQTLVFGLPGTGSTALLGSPYSTPVAVQVQMTRQGIYNDILIQGTGTANTPTYTGPGGAPTGAPVLAQAQDTNPQSPTYIGGGLGNIPNFVASSLVTAAGAPAMAANDLQVALSSSWTVTLSIPPMPILDIDDVVTITRPRVGLNNVKVVIDTITHSIRYADISTFTGRVVV